MPTILVASDSKEVREQVQTALVRPGFTVVQAERGQDVRPYVAQSPPDLVVLDMQIGNMGGVATALDLQLEASAGRAAEVPIVLLLDRPADRFLAHRVEAEAVLVKPLDAGSLRRTVHRVIDAASSDTAATTQVPTEAPREVEDETPAPAATAEPGA